ncbi:hypothetical protein [Chryseobacterium sp. Mn2064]
MKLTLQRKNIPTFSDCKDAVVLLNIMSRLASAGLNVLSNVG